jgi:hypothetical protein
VTSDDHVDRHVFYTEGQARSLGLLPAEEDDEGSVAGQLRRSVALARAHVFVDDGDTPEQAAEKAGIPVEALLESIASVDRVHHEYPPADIAPPTEPTAVELLQRAMVDTYGLDDIRPPRAVIDGVLYQDSIAWLIGPPGHGKSFVALDMAGCVANHQPWQGSPVRGGPVLYICAEGASGLRQRVRAWEAAMGIRMTTCFFLPLAVQVAVGGDWDALCEAARQLRPRMVVIDTQARATVGMEENSARDMGVFVAAIERLRRSCGAVVLVVHHQGRVGEHMRGSTALEGAATTILRVTKDEDILTLRCTKQKDAPEFDDILLRLVPRDDSAILMLTDGRGRSDGASPAAMKTASLWREHHGEEWIPASKLVDVVAPKSTVYRHIQELQRAGLVFVDSSGRFIRYALAAEVEPS